MANRRFYTDLTELRPGVKLFLNRTESQHVRKVLRRSVGDSVEVFNGQAAFAAEIIGGDKGLVRVRLTERLVEPALIAPAVTLFLSLVKLSRLELALQQVVEMGINEIVIVAADFSQIKQEQYFYKQDRFKHIIIEACKQSQALVVPPLQAVVPFAKLPELTDQFDRVLLFDTTTSPTDWLSIKFGANERIAYIIGPEGGFSPRELSLAQECSWQSVSLPGNILRTETAAVAALSAIRTHAELTG